MVLAAPAASISYDSYGFEETPVGPDGPTCHHPVLYLHLVVSHALGPPFSSRSSSST